MYANWMSRASPLVVAFGMATAASSGAHAQWQPRPIPAEVEREKLVQQQQVLERTERDIERMEAAIRRGDCVGSKQILDELADYLGTPLSATLQPPDGPPMNFEWTPFDLIGYSMFLALDRRVTEIINRPCPPGSQDEPPVESVLDDLQPNPATIIGVPERPADGEESWPSTSDSEGVESVIDDLQFNPATIVGVPESREGGEGSPNPGQAAESPIEDADPPPPEPLDPASAAMLAEHNRLRAEVGSPPLRWNSDLASGAAAYGPVLSQGGTLGHSSREGRRTIRENLLQSPRGVYSPLEMVQVWSAEQQYFIPGIFPDVSTDGNWTSIAHYTQMIWPTTTDLGCAIHSDQSYDWLICRYSPPGNRDGDAIGTPTTATTQTPAVDPPPP